MSWIGRDDVVRLIDHAMRDARISGPLNAVAPGAVRNLEFARTVGAALHRPALIPLPETVLKAGLGDLAREIFLGDQLVKPQRALETGFVFLDPELGALLRRLVGTIDRNPAQKYAGREPNVPAEAGRA
jgi:NAD dependent epimerase/dehydratase family enzyme